MHNMADCITSLASPHVKEVNKLLEKSKARREAKAFVMEGLRAVSEVPRELIRKLYYTEKCSEAAGLICGDVAFKGEAYLMAENVMNAMSDTKTPQGLLAVVGFPFEGLDGAELFEKPGIYLFLESLQDPGNLGTIIRTAQGAGVEAVIMSRDCVDIYSPKVVRATMSSLFRVKHVVLDEFSEGLSRAKMAGVKTYAAALGGKKGFWDIDFRSDKSIGFAIGNEGNGLTPSTIDACDEALIIPMSGGLESLNAAMAAGLLMYEAAGQRR